MALMLIILFRPRQTFAKLNKTKTSKIKWQLSSDFLESPGNVGMLLAFD